jgi:hypothetical protein
MKTILKSFKILVTLVLLFAATTVKAQITALSGLATGTIKAYCLTGDPVKLTAATPSGGAATSYTWVRYAGQTAGTPGSGTAITAATSTTIVDTPPAAGYYTYVSTGINASGCMSDPSPPAVVYILPAPAVSIASNITNPSFCVNALPTGAAAVTLTATASTPSVSEGFAYTYQWYKGTTAISGATNATYPLTTADAAAAGASDYTVQVGLQIKTCALTTSNIVTVTVNALPGTPAITITP